MGLAEKFLKVASGGGRGMRYAVSEEAPGSQTIPPAPPLPKQGPKAPETAPVPSQTPSRHLTRLGLGRRSPFFAAHFLSADPAPGRPPLRFSLDLPRQASTPPPAHPHPHTHLPTSVDPFSILPSPPFPPPLSLTTGLSSVFKRS